MPAQDSPSSPPRGQLKKLKQSLRPCSRLKESCGVPWGSAHHFPFLPPHQGLFLPGPTR